MRRTASATPTRSRTCSRSPASTSIDRRFDSPGPRSDARFRRPRRQRSDLGHLMVAVPQAPRGGAASALGDGDYLHARLAHHRRGTAARLRPAAGNAGALAARRRGGNNERRLQLGGRHRRCRSRRPALLSDAAVDGAARPPRPGRAPDAFGGAAHRPGPRRGRDRALADRAGAGIPLAAAAIARRLARRRRRLLVRVQQRDAAARSRSPRRRPGAGDVRGRRDRRRGARRSPRGRGPGAVAAGASRGLAAANGRTDAALSQRQSLAAVRRGASLCEPRGGGDAHRSRLRVGLGHRFRRRHDDGATGARRWPHRRQRLARRVGAGQGALSCDGAGAAMPGFHSPGYHAGVSFPRGDAMTDTPHSIYDFEALSIDGKPAHLSTQRGKVMLIVNTASKCGFTPQFAGLEELWKEYRDKGFVLLGFPSNQFGAQDPGSNDEISSFCQINYGVSFPMMSKVDVNGDKAHPLWKWLTAEAPGILGTKAIKWNFTKFLIGKDGRVLKRYAPNDSPASLKGDIEAALAA